MQTTINNTPFLRFALLGDAAASGATGLLMAAGSSFLEPLVGLPQTLLFWAGLFLLPYAAMVGWLGSRAALAPAAVGLVIGANALWVVGSFLLLTSGWVQPTTLGTAFVLMQAAAVAVFAELQFMALRKARQGRMAAA